MTYISLTRCVKLSVSEKMGVGYGLSSSDDIEVGILINFIVLDGGFVVAFELLIVAMDLVLKESCFEFF